MTIVKVAAAETSTSELHDLSRRVFSQRYSPRFLVVLAHKKKTFNDWRERERERERELFSAN